MTRMAPVLGRAAAAMLLAVAAAAQQQAKAIASVVHGAVVGIVVIEGGSGYFEEPAVTIAGGDGSGATAVATVQNGSVDTVHVINPGFGYSYPPEVIIAAPRGPELRLQMVPGLWITGPAGDYLIQSSEQVPLAWLAVTNIQLTGGAYFFADATATNAPKRLYRAVRVTAPEGMVTVPAGTFLMGDALNDAPGPDEQPVHTATLNAFYIDRTEITLGQWQAVQQWALNHGYDLAGVGKGKADSHPVVNVSWYDVVKWCNARSEKEGRTPAYYTDSARTPTTVYRSGSVDVQNDWVSWEAGYRLPTEAEWEYAARGGLGGKRFPATDTLSFSQANYYGGAGYVYDLSPEKGYHPGYAVGDYPYTSPAGSFAPNDFGLHDMAGNVREWCWDWYAGYDGAGVNPRGPASGSIRVLRGGGWGSNASYCRVASRESALPDDRFVTYGFRAVVAGR